MYGVLHRKAMETAEMEAQAVSGGLNTSSLEPVKPPPQLAEHCKRDYMAFTRYALGFPMHISAHSTVKHP